MLLADKYRDVGVILKPLDMDFRLCNSITDSVLRAACMQYSIFFTAIREEDPAICANYGNDIHSLAVWPERLYRGDINAKHYWESLTFLRPYQACMTVLALKRNDVALCNAINNTLPDPGLGTDCITSFDDVQLVGMRGVTDIAFKRFLCAEFDSRRYSLTGNFNRFHALGEGIRVYRSACE
jgi:hypothetical protein